MIDIYLNGEIQKFEAPITLSEILERLRIPLSAMAIAVNREIVPRSEFPLFKIKEGDRIEVVKAVGGG
ncbi:MAG: sulfur carrier protein ThiS [Deltaproteobacteria bacterium]|nr:sulfur carrier protein ThiS [Deltaproteobacteria bacterium]MBI2501238.1 sulfur carrier protein ThiS [Deltaproteobacteria bacterium]